LWAFTQNALKFVHGAAEFFAGFLQRKSMKMILPAKMVVAMNADGKSSGFDGAQNRFVPPTDVRSREQRAGQQCAPAIELGDPRAADFFQEAWTKDAANSFAGVVRTKAEEKGGPHGMAFQNRDERGNAFSRAAIGVD